MLRINKKTPRATLFTDICKNIKCQKNLKMTIYFKYGKKKKKKEYMAAEFEHTTKVL